MIEGTAAMMSVCHQVMPPSWQVNQHADTLPATIHP